MKEIFWEGTKMATEYELKYSATPAILAAVENAFPGAWEKVQMETTYYDTPDRALSALRYTLRKRLQNGISVCTLKTPAGAARGEWETECNSIEDAIGKLISLGAPADLAELTREGLVHTCGAKFTRLAKTVSIPGGSVELALDQGCLIGGGTTEPLCELEVELKTGTQEACDAFAETLSTRYALLPEQKSKFARALALHKGE